MIKNILSQRANKCIVYIILTNMIFIALYKIVAVIVVKRNLLFRGWVDMLYLVNIMILIIAGLIVINMFVRAGLNSKVKSELLKNNLKKISTVIIGIIMSICCLGGFLDISLSYEPEHIVDMEGRVVIAKLSDMFLRTNVNYYEPVNIFLMKSANIDSETYKGGYDRYVK